MTAVYLMDVKYEGRQHIYYSCLPIYFLFGLKLIYMKIDSLPCKPVWLGIY